MAERRGFTGNNLQSFLACNPFISATKVAPAAAKSAIQKALAAGKQKAKGGGKTAAAPREKRPGTAAATDAPAVVSCKYSQFGTPTTEGGDADENFYPDFSVGPPVSLGGARRRESWWRTYVRGENPDYPPRKRSFEFLAAAGVDPYRLSMRQIEDWVRWVEIRRQCQLMAKPGTQNFFHPIFPEGDTFNAKLRRIARQFPASQATEPL